MLLYAVAPDLDQLSVLEAQLNKKKNQLSTPKTTQHLISKSDFLKQNRNTEINPNILNCNHLESQLNSQLLNSQFINQSKLGFSGFTIKSSISSKFINRIPNLIQLEFSSNLLNSKAHSSISNY